eukprot:COSAG02_NODE_65930_length_256_cov_3.445860_1_plen_70_part_10
MRYCELARPLPADVVADSSRTITAFNAEQTALIMDAAPHNPHPSYPTFTVTVRTPATNDADCDDHVSQVQ